MFGNFLFSSGDNMQAYPDQANTKITANHFARLLTLLVIGASLLVLTQSGCSAQVTTNKSAATKSASSNSQEQAARETLEKLIHAYESGESITADPYLDPAMVGTQVLLENIRDTQAQQKQIRVILKDTQTAASADVVIFTSRWEKRYLALPGMTPKLATGTASLMMSYSAAGWRLSGMTGDNLFAAHAN
jgi:hypothetical protein